MVETKKTAYHSDFSTPLAMPASFEMTAPEGFFLFTGMGIIKVNEPTGVTYESRY
ncbi:MAG: hypothetical protein K8R40_10360 [Anaerolineaceae bacterium]|nr:hypothetical protein [Anaerolineaceae bacterium]